MTFRQPCYTTCPLLRCRDCRHPETRPAPPFRVDPVHVAEHIDRLKAIADRIRATQPKDEE